MFKSFFLIKIPKNIKIYIDSKKNYLLLKNLNNKKLIKVNSKFLKIKKNRTGIICLYVFWEKFKIKKTLSKPDLKRKLLFFKKLLKEIMINNYKKLQLNGIGYKMRIIESYPNNIIHLKIGYSHSLYFKLPVNITAKITKANILFLFSHSFKNLTFISSLIKNCKKPDPYKGKGILYVNEKITLKIGKKS